MPVQRIPTHFNGHSRGRGSSHGHGRGFPVAQGGGGGRGGRGGGRGHSAPVSAGKKHPPRRHISWESARPTVTQVLAPPPAARPQLWFQEGERRVTVPRMIPLKPGGAARIKPEAPVKIVCISVIVPTDGSAPPAARAPKAEPRVAVEVRPTAQSESALLEELFSATATVEEITAKLNKKHKQSGGAWTTIGSVPATGGTARIKAMLPPGEYELRTAGANVPVLVNTELTGFTNCLV